MCDEHYLKKELYGLVRNDPQIFEFLQASALDGIWYWDLENPEHEWMSHRFWEVFGYDWTSKKHLSSEWQHVIYPDDLRVLLNNFHRHCLDPNYPYDQYVRYWHKDGSTVWVRCRGITIRDQNSKPIRMLGAHIDVTELKLAQERIAQLMERLDLATSAARIGVWDWDIIKDELVWDDRMFDLYGIKKEDFSGAYQSWLFGVHPEDQALCEQAIYQALRNEKSYDIEFRICRPDGIVRVIKADGRVLWDAQGNPMRMLGTNYDITERKHAEETNHKVNEQLQRTNKELEAFSYSVSHDLRAPLRAINGFAQVLEENYHDRLDDEGCHFLGIIRQNTVKMGQLIDDLLAFSRLSRCVVNPQRVEMAELARDAFDEVCSFESDRRIEFRLATLPVVFGDLAMLRQVWFNLLSNAVKYTRPRTVAIIEVKGMIKDEMACFSVQDNGVGFDMKYAHNLFGVFQRLHPEGDFEGTGVGLALVSRIVERHGGQIWANSTLDMGSIFMFTLPIAP